VIEVTGKNCRMGTSETGLNVGGSASVVRTAHAKIGERAILSLGDTMRNLGMAAVAAALLVGSAPLVRAQSLDRSPTPLHPRVTHREAHELRSDRREIRHDTREVRGDNHEIRQDRRELRQDTREIRHDDTRTERRQDIRERRQDQRDLNRDLRDRRGDRRDRNQDVRDFRRDRRQARSS